MGAGWNPGCKVAVQLASGDVYCASLGWPHPDYTAFQADTVRLLHRIRGPVAGADTIKDGGHLRAALVLFLHCYSTAGHNSSLQVPPWASL